MAKKSNNHGGARLGAGRPKARPTKTLAWRVPADIAPTLKAKIDALIKKELVKHKVDNDQ